MIEIDGSREEGGGQMLRTSLSLSALTGKPFTIKHIRANRPKPGLARQHLTAVNAAAAVCSAKVSGAELGLTNLVFEPGKIKGGDFAFDVGSAGSTMLVLQTILPILSFAPAPSKVRLSGGTSVPFSPPAEYVQKVFLFWACSMGIQARLRIEQPGWYPIGGGRAVVEVSPVRGLDALEVNSRGKLSRLTANAIYSNLNSEIARRMNSAATKFFTKNKLSIVPEYDIVETDSPSKGGLFFIDASYVNSVAGFSCFAQKGKSSEEVARSACADFVAFNSTSASIDEHAADQLSLYCALAAGRSSFTTPSFSGHLRTNVSIIEKFLPVKFNLTEGRPAKLVVTGAGFTGRA